MWQLHMEMVYELINPIKLPQNYKALQIFKTSKFFAELAVS